MWHKYTKQQINTAKHHHHYSISHMEEKWRIWYEDWRNKNGQGEKDDLVKYPKQLITEKVHVLEPKHIIIINEASLNIWVLSFPTFSSNKINVIIIIICSNIIWEKLSMMPLPDPPSSSILRLFLMWWNWLILNLVRSSLHWMITKSARVKGSSVSRSRQLFTLMFSWSTACNIQWHGRLSLVVTKNLTTWSISN